MIKFFVDVNGNYIGSFDGSPAPDGAIEVLEAPKDARDKWINGAWDETERRAFDNDLNAKEKLIEIDLASIRSIREYIVSKADAPQLLKDKEAAAALERAKIK